MQKLILKTPRLGSSIDLLPKIGKNILYKKGQREIILYLYT